jgi:elongation factor Ts
VADISTAMIKELREATQCGVMDAKRALEAAGGDMKKARDVIREQGLLSAAKRTDRQTNQGIVEAYIHGGGRIGVLIELNCETDFVANTPDFRQLAKDVAMQVAAMNPLVVTAEERTPEMEGTDAEIALMSQPFIRDSGRNIGDLVKDVIARTGENVRVTRFTRFELGR